MVQILRKFTTLAMLNEGLSWGSEQSEHEEAPLALSSFNYKVKEAFITGSEGKTRPHKGKQRHKACLCYPEYASVQRDKYDLDWSNLSIASLICGEKRATFTSHGL